MTEYNNKNNSGNFNKNKNPGNPGDEADVVLSEDRLEGKNPVLEALKAGRTIQKLWVQKPVPGSGRLDPTLSKIINLSKDTGAIVIELEKRALDQMSQTHGHQGVIAQVAMHDYVEIDVMIENAKVKGEQPFLIILDEIKDSYNLGSILRIADAAGAHGIVIPKHRSVGLDATVAKASAGAMEYVPVAKVTNLSQTIETLKEKGFWIVGTDSEGTSRYDQIDYKGALAIVVGSEGEGIGRLIKKNCDFLVTIPMHGQVNSLNAAVAAGIVVFEAAKMRNASTKAKG